MHHKLSVNIHFLCPHDKYTFGQDRNEVKQNWVEKIVSIGSNTEMPDRNLSVHEMIEPIDNNSRLALLHFQYYGKHAELNVELFDNPKNLF